MAGPFSDVRLRLKQADMAALGEPGRSLFTAVLGSYGLSLTEDDIADGQARLSRTLGGTEVKFEWGGRRSAYLLGSTYPGLITLFDSDGMQTMEFLGILADIPDRNYQALDFTQLSLLMAIHPLAPDPARTSPC
jgi:hypothetical protein